MSQRENNNIKDEKVIYLFFHALGTQILKQSVHLMKKCWMPLAILIITLAVVFSLFRALTPWAKQYKGEVEKHLSSLLGQPVVINSMETSWYWFEPVLKLNQVTVLDNGDHVLKLAKLLVGINLISSLWHWHIQPGILYIDDVHLILRQVNNRWQIDGLRQDRQITTLEADAYLPILGWILEQQKIIIKNVSALVHLNDGSLLPLSALNLTAINRNGHYRLKGEAKLAQTMATELLVLADWYVNPNALQKISGHAYFSVHRFLPTQWQIFFPTSHYHIDGGKGDFEVWLDVLKGRFSGIQTKLNLHRIEWGQEGHPQSQFIQSLQANLAWNPTSDGWQLSGDQIKLRANGIRWPENSFLINHRQSQQSYSLFLKALLLEPLLATDIEWPEIMQPMLEMHPRGQLSDTQIEVNNGKINYLLARFVDFGWRERHSIPSVDNMSGVLSWQPTEGRLELDGENTIVAIHGLPPITFTQANAAFEWIELSSGLRISMERLLLSQADLILSARGAIDEPFSPDLSHLRFTAEFSADHAAQWLAYIPSQYVKPKLDDWLKHDIKRIDKASGQLTINGALADFPFDEKPGEFTITSRLSGMDLYFHRKWPPIRNIDLNLHIDKRTLDIDVIHASLKDMESEQANLSIDNMGLGKEALLLHGKVDVAANKLKSYVFATPLRSHLARLKTLDIKGPLALDLNLEIPLYPENDDVLARGIIALNNNTVTFHHALNDVQLSHLSGSLQFDEHGVTDSALNARLSGEPVAMHINSVRQPQPYTMIHIDGQTTIDILRKKLELPILSFMRGHLNVTSTLTLTDDPNDLDNIKFNTSLEGVSVDLPEPLGKSSEEKAPLTMNVDFNSEKAVRLRFDYDKRFSSDLWFVAKKGALKLDKGEVRVGSVQAVSQKLPGLQVMGSLPFFNVQQWLDIWSQLPAGTSSINAIQHVDMQFGEMAVWGKNYQKVAIKADKLGQDTWSFKLDQRDIAGDLRYQYASNTLSGRFMRLYLAKPDWVHQRSVTSTSSIKPGDIPNLNLTVDALKLGKIGIGTVALKSVSTDSNWHLDYCKIASPEYQLMLKGDWSLRDGANNTVLDAELRFDDMAKSLQLWHMTPVIETHQGGVEFHGGWSGAINDFSLARANGNMHLMFQNGLITHLSKETEEKLGLGKLLSILSLQTIPRRLKLDFSDLSNPGYSFDVLKGNFTLKNGVLNTTDSYIDGPVAYASMKGDLDVVKQLYDITLHVSPHITASLPVVATIAGGPIAGVATWVASKIINQGMQQVTGYTYKVSGPWLSPIVQQVSIFKK